MVKLSTTGNTMNLNAGKTTFDGVLRLEVMPSPIIKDLQAKISATVPGQLPVIDRYMHVSLVGIAHLKPYKEALKAASFPTYTRALEFEDNPRIAQAGESKSTFIYATPTTSQQLSAYVSSILTPLNIPMEEGRKFHLSLTNLTGFGPNNIGPVWLHDQPLNLITKGTAMKMSSILVEKLDDLASHLESLGMVKEAHDLDVVSNTIDSSGDWAGKLCKFKKIQTPSEEKSLMEVLEDRGNRVLVTDLYYSKDMTLKPTHTYLKSDLVIVNEKDKKKY